MSYNIWGWNPEPEAMVKLIKQEQPDILLLQEVTPRLARLLSSELTDLYPNGRLHVAYDPDIGQVILSRYPLTPVEEGSYRKGRTQKVLANTPHGDIAVWNTHPVHPLPWRQQYRQISALVEDIAVTNQPLLVGGDFNTTDQSETYRMINQYLHNAHWETGWGFGFSFPSTDRPLRGKLPLPAMVRIDHIFYSDHFFAHSARTLAEAGGSDHFPVVAELSRPN
jgi:endonuclease/exonuclease/phosphatase (EEP) superfamily protein YafD